MLKWSGKHSIPQELIDNYTDFEFQYEGYCYEAYQVKSLKDGKIYQAHVLNKNNELYKEKPDLATTQFIRELLYLQSFAPEYVDIQSLAYSGGNLGYITKPILNFRIDNFTRPFLHTIEECKRFTEQMFSGLRLVQRRLESYLNSPFKLALENVSCSADKQYFFLADTSNVILQYTETNEDDDIQRDTPAEKFNELENLYNIGLAILQLEGAELKDLNYLSEKRDKKSYMPYLEALIKEINVPEPVSAFVLRILNFQELKELKELKKKELFFTAEKKIPEGEPALKETNEDVHMLKETKENEIALKETKGNEIALKETKGNEIALKETKEDKVALKDTNEEEIQFSERVRISQPDRYPYSTIGIVRYLNKDVQEPLWGTGTLIGPNIVLTAAYNLLDFATKEYYTKIEFLILENSSYRSYEVASCCVPNNYKLQNIDNQDDISCNYGILILKEPIGEKIGYLGLHISDKSAPLKGKQYYLAGYPKDKIFGKGESYELWGACGELAFDSSQNMLLYDIQTDQGQGGASIFYRNQNGGYYVVGVHSGAFSKDEKFGTWIRSTYFNEITKWIQDFMGEFKTVSFNP